MLGLGCSLIIVVILLSAKEDRFQKLLDKQENPDLEERLRDFRKGGIERAAEASGYEPERIIAEAYSFIGTPASMGGLSHKGIDCSGLVMMAHKSCQLELPHNAEEQARYGTVVYSTEELQRGDLVFFYDSYSSSKLITHSGIYLGEQEFIHTSTSKGVTVSRIDDPFYWKERFLFATRLAN